MNEYRFNSRDGQTANLRRESPPISATSRHLIHFPSAALSTISSNDMSEKWESYLTTIDDKPASVFLDVGIADEAPREDYRVRLGVRVIQKVPRADGLTTQEEAHRLWPLEDALRPAVEQWGAIFVGRITSDGYREFVFYGSSASGFDVVVSTALAPFGYDVDTLDAADAGWTFYFDILYPTPWDWQKIMNRQLLDHIQRGGDDLSKPRGVFHWLYFSMPADRERCAAAAREKGFGVRILPTAKQPDGRHPPLGLQLYRVDSIGPNAIDNICIDLLNLAIEHSGEYDGWETQIVAAGAEPIDDTPRD